MKLFPYWQDYPQTLTGPADILAFDASAAWLSVYAAQEEFEISLDGGPWLKINQGLRLGISDDSRAAQLVGIKIRAKSGAATFPNAIVLRLGVNDYTDARFSVSAPLQIAAGATIKQAKPSQLVTPADVVLIAATNTPIFAANANATRRTVRNTSATADVRISTTAADLTAGRGKLVKAGEEWETEVTGALYARSAGTPTLVLAEETF